MISDLDLQSQVKVKVMVKDQSIRKLEWKQTDGRTDGRTEAIALLPMITRSVITKYVNIQLIELENPRIAAKSSRKSVGVNN